MFKKLIISCMAVVAFAAFVLPATASATNTPTLKDAGGHVAVGSLITGTSVGKTIFWNTAKTVEQVTCEAYLTGKLLKNETGNVEGEITTARFSLAGTPVHADNGLPECHASFGNAYVTVTNLPMIVKSNTTMATHEFQVTGKAGAKVKFLIGSTTAGECEYEATGNILGDYTTGESATKDSLFTVRNTQSGSGAKLIRGSFLCPSSGQLQMQFTMETDTTPKTDADPIWVTS